MVVHASIGIMIAIMIIIANVHLGTVEEIARYLELASLLRVLIPIWYLIGSNFISYHMRCIL